MSIREELIGLVEARQDLDRQKSFIHSQLNDLESEKISQEQRVHEFRIRISPLAKALCEQEEAKLRDLQEQIKQKKEELENISTAIATNSQEIAKREETPTLYFQEQIPRMVAEFLAYIETHKEEIGMELRKNYAIIEITINRRFASDFCDNVPTGNFGIYDIKNNVIITQSQDFYFTVTLYTEGGNSMLLEAVPTPWYREYKKKFIAYLINELKKNYTLSDTFRLTVKSPKITLDLV